MTCLPGFFRLRKKEEICRKITVEVSQQVGGVVANVSERETAPGIDHKPGLGQVIVLPFVNKEWTVCLKTVDCRLWVVDCGLCVCRI